MKLTRRRRPSDKRFTVDNDSRTFADLGPALSLAITLAGRYEGAATVEVREWEDVVARVNRNVDGTIETRWLA